MGVYLSVKQFVEEQKEWATIGATPWVRIEDNGATQVNENLNDSVMKYWTFDQFSFAKNLSKVLLQVKAATTYMYYNGVHCYIWDGAWQYVGYLYYGEHMGMYWKELDVTAVLNTLAKINSSRVYIVKGGIVGYYVYVDCIRLKVTAERIVATSQLVDKGIEGTVKEK